MTITSLQRPFRLGLRWLLIALVGTLLAVMTTQIVLRYGFNGSLLWAEEMCRYMLIWMAFLAVVLAFERGEIAALGLMGSLLPRVPALILGIACAAISLVLCLLLAWYGWSYAERAGRSAIPAMGFILEGLFGENAPATPGRFWVYVALPIGMVLLSLRLIADIVLCVRAIGTGATLHDTLGRDATEVVE